MSRGGRCRRLALAAAGTAGVVAAALSSGAQATAASTPLTVAVLGDVPYGTTQAAQFPALIRAIDVDPAVSVVLHAGDVKASTELCSDSLLRSRAALFDSFADPFVLTPGDNEWTDCHKAAAGQYVPTERLTGVRQIFYPQPGVTLGQTPMTVTTQGSTTPYRENVRFEQSGVVFATVHVVGSQNDRSRWSGLPGGDRPAERVAEYTARDAADRAWIDAAFDAAQANGAAGVLLLMQAEPKDTAAFSAVRSKLVERARSFGRPVLLVHGDEHHYEVEKGFAGVPNLTRLETYGSTATKWLRLTIDPGTAAVFAWQPKVVR